MTIQYSFPRDEAMPNLAAISRSLAQFASSDRSFQIIHTFPPSLARLPTTRLYILDSSFNPPTLAHMRMCLSALRDEREKTQDKRKGVKRVLLLLATKNADKAAVPAAFDHRLAMMGCLAEDLRRALKGNATTRGVGAEEPMQEEKKGSDPGQGEAIDAANETNLGDQDLIVDVGVTKEAMFVAKAQAIEESEAYTFPKDHEAKTVEQVHLTGFDTLLRLIDVKYYPNKSLRSLNGLLEFHRVRVTMREPPPKAEQEQFVKGLEGSEWEAKGWKKEWAKKVELVEGRDEQVS